MTDAVPRPLVRRPPATSARWPLRRRHGVAGDDAVARDAVAPSRPAPGSRRPPGRLRVLLWRLRRPFAAVLLGCAAALALADLRPVPPPTAAVVVTAHAVDAGAPLAPTDLAVVHVPSGAVADGAHRDPAAVVGRVVVVGVPAGLPVVDALLRDDRLVLAGPPGTVVAPVRLADPGVAELLRPGDRVDLFAAATTSTGGPAAERLARRALVLAHPAGDEREHDGAGLLGGAPQGPGLLTLVAVPPEQAAALAGASAWAGITAVVVR